MRKRINNILPRRKKGGRGQGHGDEDDLAGLTGNSQSSGGQYNTSDIENDRDALEVAPSPRSYKSTDPYSSAESRQAHGKNQGSSKAPRSKKERTHRTQDSRAAENGGNVTRSRGQGGKIEQRGVEHAGNNRSTVPQRLSPKGAMANVPTMDGAAKDAHLFGDDAPSVVKSYDAVPLLEQTKLPRGGISMETKAVGRVQVRDFT